MNILRYRPKMDDLTAGFAANAPSSAVTDQASCRISLAGHFACFLMLKVMLLLHLGWAARSSRSHNAGIECQINQSIRTKPKKLAAM